MKKVFIISFLIFTMLLSFLSASYAAITVTEESLQKSFDKYATSSENKETNNSMKIDKINKKIKLISEGTEYLIDYDLTSKPTFTINLNYLTSMTKEEGIEESSKPILLMTMFVLIADHAGINPNDSLAYMMQIDSLKNLNTTMTEIPDTITNAVEYAKFLYKDKENTTKTDDLFTWTIRKTSETSTEYKVQSTLVVNNDADFSILNNYFDNSLEGNLENAANKYINAAEKESQALQNYLSSISNNTTKLPQTGKTFEITDALYLLCIVSSVALIAIIFKSIKYKKI